MPKWLFLERKPSHSATGDAFRNTFEGADPSAALARETIQNSVDARTSDSVLIKYIKKDVDLSPLLCELYWRHAEASGISRDLRRTTSEVLFVEDFYTTGLSGGMHDLNSNFYKLMGQLGGSEKHHGEGGSFGYGKAACILASQCYTILAYTITPNGSALLGTCYFNQHTIGSGSFTGLGWFCDERSQEDFPSELLDDDADRLARLLGFPRANTGETGTSLMIVCPDVQLHNLRGQIERFWWPRLKDLQLTVELTDGSTYVPMPDSDPSLRPMIELYDVAVGRSASSPEVARKEIRTHTRKLGVLALRFLSDAPQEEDDSSINGTIALIRDQRMVVKYYKWKGGPRSDFIGVFVADHSINDDLRMLEPLQHDDWSITANRATQEQRELGKSLYNAIRREYRSYLNTWEPSPIQDDSSLRDLRRQLGKLLSFPGKGGGGHEADLVKIINKSAQAVPAGSHLQLKGSAQFEWKGNVNATLKLGVNVRLAESDVSDRGEELAVRVYDPDGRSASIEGNFLVWFASPNSAVRVTFESELYDPHWTATATFFAEEHP